jgi:uncharacterized protein (DUF58 family)
MLTHKGYAVLSSAIGNFIISLLIAYPPLLLLSMLITLGLTFYIIAFHKAIEGVRSESFQVTRRVTPDSQVRGGQLNVQVDFDLDYHRQFGLRLRETIPSELSIQSGRAENELHAQSDTIPSLNYTLTALSVGKYVVGPMEATLMDGGRLCERLLRIGDASEIIVRPNIHQIPRAVIRASHMDAIMQGELTRHAVTSREEEYREIREYAPGDSHRHIVWRAVAKDPLNELFIKELEGFASHDVMCVVDSSPSMRVGPPGFRPFDVVTDAVASLGSLVLDRGDRLGVFCWNSEGEVYLPPYRGKSQLEAAARLMAEAKPTGSIGSLDELTERLMALLKGRALVIVCSRLVGQSAAQLEAAMITLASQGSRLTAIVPLMNQMPALTEPDAFSVALDIERQRVREFLDRSKRANPRVAEYSDYAKVLFYSYLALVAAPMVRR